VKQDATRTTQHLRDCLCRCDDVIEHAIAGRQLSEGGGICIVSGLLTVKEGAVFGSFVNRQGSGTVFMSVKRLAMRFLFTALPAVDKKSQYFVCKVTYTSAKHCLNLLLCITNTLRRMNLEVCDKQFLASGLNGDKRHLQ
jgi:hypothetical protein